MNILMVTPMPPRPQAPGAIPVVLHAQLQGLLRRHRVTVVTVAGPEPGEQQAVEQLQAAGIPVYATLRSEPRGWERWQRRWRLSQLWLLRNWPWRSVWFYDADAQRQIDRALSEEAFDLVQVDDNAMGVYNYPATIPKVFTEYEVRRGRRVNWHLPTPGQWPGWLFREADWQRWRRYQQKVWQKFDRLQALTPRDAEAMRQLAPQLAGRIRVNPFGVELPPVTQRVNEDSRRLLFVGNFTHPPNVDAALWLGREIMPLVWAQQPEACLTLVGIFPPAEVQALAGPNVSATGPVPDIAPYFEQAAVVVAPVRTGGGMRTKVLQAMAYGKPVVTTARGAEGLRVNELPLPLVIAEEAEGIAEAAARLLADPARRRSLGEAARAYVAEHFSVEAYALRLEATYAELRTAGEPGLSTARPMTAAAAPVTNRPA